MATLRDSVIIMNETYGIRPLHDGTPNDYEVPITLQPHAKVTSTSMPNDYETPFTQSRDRALPLQPHVAASNKDDLPQFDYEPIPI